MKCLIKQLRVELEYIKFIYSKGNVEGYMGRYNNYKRNVMKINQ